MTATGYGAAFDVYYKLGWPGVLALRAFTKYPPPEGHTGHDGVDPSPVVGHLLRRRLSHRLRRRETGPQHHRVVPGLDTCDQVTRVDHEQSPP